MSKEPVYFLYPRERKYQSIYQLVRSPTTGIGVDLSIFNGQPY